MEAWQEDGCSLADAVRRGEVRAADAVEASLEAIANSTLNALTYLDVEGARRQAEAIDVRVSKGDDPGPFAGVPMLVKDLEDVDGWPTTQGSLVFKDNIAESDSTHVARLRGAGAVFVGKSATSEFGFVAYTATKLHGVTRNPWNLERTPAGSSGGTAAAVAGSCPTKSWTNTRGRTRQRKKSRASRTTPGIGPKRFGPAAKPGPISATVGR